MGRPTVNIVKQRFNRLFVLRMVDSKKCECICDCGNLCYPDKGSLISGVTGSCGCLEKELTKARATIKEDEYLDILREYIFSNHTLDKIGKPRGVTRERIRQIVNKFGKKQELDKLRKSITKFKNRNEVTKERKLLIIKNRYIARFWSMVDVKSDDECWEWTGFKNPESDYGTGATMRFGGRLEKISHRIAWSLVHGKITNGDWVLHNCDNPSCCNPKHLYLGNAHDNAKDRETRGRSNRAALTRKDKIEILQRKDENLPDLAREYGVTSANIRRLFIMGLRDRFSKSDKVNIILDSFSIPEEKLMEKYRISSKEYLHHILNQVKSRRVVASTPPEPSI